MSEIHSYGSLLQLSNKFADKLLDGPVLIEEKVDGSQFSFGIYEEEGKMVLRCRSKGKELILDNPEKMFAIGVEKVGEVQESLIPNATYRAEYLNKPKHNTLAYDRAPKNNILIFDVDRGNQDYMTYEEKKKEAERLGFEVTPLIYYGTIEKADQIPPMLDRVSILGGQKIEGVVVKNYAQMGPDKKTLMCKYVSEDFKEIHQGEWKKANPSLTDVIDQLGADLCTPARWNKAIQHLREAGQLTDSPKDIGLLINEVKRDVFKEEIEMIKDRLFNHASSKIARMIIAGLPEWYKEKLLETQE